MPYTHPPSADFFSHDNPLSVSLAHPCPSTYNIPTAAGRSDCMWDGSGGGRGGKRDEGGERETPSDVAGITVNMQLSPMNLIIPQKWMYTGQACTKS